MPSAFAGECTESWEAKMESQSSSISARTYRGWSANLFASSVVAEGPRETIYLAGLASNEPLDGSVRHVDDVAAQTFYTYEKVKEVLALHGATLADIVKTTAYVTDADFLPVYSKCRLEVFGDTPLTPHTFLVVKALARPEMLVEVDIVASIPDDGSRVAVADS